MAIKKEELHQLIKAAFADSDINIVDLAGDGDHYKVEIASSIFMGKTKIAQHRLVNEALRGRLGGELHALSIKTIIK